ncbi:MAG: hypothetical protein ACKO37_00410 [Vampirovibrionales bacterium]
MTSLTSLRHVGSQSAYRVLSAMDSKSMLPIFMRDCVDNVRRVAITKAWNPTAGEELFRTEWVTAFVWGWGVNLATKAWDTFFHKTGVKPSSHLGWEDLKSLFGKIPATGFAGRSLKFHTSPQATFLHQLSPEALAKLAPSQEELHRVRPLLADLKAGRMTPHLQHYAAKVAFTMMAPSLFIGVGLPFLNHYYTEEKRKKILATTTNPVEGAVKDDMKDPSLQTHVLNQGKLLKSKDAKNTLSTSVSLGNPAFPATSVIFSPEVHSPFAKQPLEYTQTPSTSVQATLNTHPPTLPSAMPSQDTSGPPSASVALPPQASLPSQGKPTARFGSASVGMMPLQSLLSFAFTERGQTLIGVDAPISLGRVFTSRDPSEAAIWSLREGLFLVMQFFGADLIQNKLTELFAKRQAGYAHERFETLHTLKQAVGQHERHGVVPEQWKQRLTQGWESLAQTLKEQPTKNTWHPHEEMKLVETIYHYFSPENRFNRMKNPNPLFDMAAHLGHIPVYKEAPEKLFGPKELEYVRSKAAQYVDGSMQQVSLLHRPLVDLTHVAGARLDKKIQTEGILELAKLLQATSEKALPALKQELNASYKYKAIALAAGNISSYLVLAELMPRAQQWLSYVIRGDKSAPGIPTELQTHTPEGLVKANTVKPKTA